MPATISEGAFARIINLLYTKNKVEDKSKDNSRSTRKFSLKSSVILGLIILFIAIIAATASFKSKSEKPAVPQPKISSLQESVPSDWISYSSARHRFELKYPPEGVNLAEETSGSVILAGVGFYKGINLKFDSGPLGGVSLKDFVEMNLDRLEASLQILVPTTERSIDEAEGYTYKAKKLDGSGEINYIFLTTRPGIYLKITASISNSDDEELQITVNQILSSLKILR